MHIGPVEQIIISKNNLLMITRSCDSVFVWDISPRAAVDHITLAETVMSKLKIEGISMEQNSERSNLQSNRTNQPLKELDEIVKYRKERETPYYPLVPLQKSELSYKRFDVEPFKPLILYHSTLLKRSKPKLEISYKCSFGLDTR